MIKKVGMIVNYNIVSYLIGEGFKNVLKNKKSTFAAFIIMFVTMITVGLGIAGGSNITSIINQLENDFPINVYIEDTASQDHIKERNKKGCTISKIVTIYTRKRILTKPDRIDEVQQVRKELVDKLVAKKTITEQEANAINIKKIY